MSASDDIKPGKVWYKVALVVFFLGLAAFSFPIKLAIDKKNHGKKIIDIPGKTKVSLEHKKRHTVHHEVLIPSDVRYKSDYYDDIKNKFPDVECKVDLVGSGRVQMLPISNSGVALFGDVVYEGIYWFDVSGPGEFVFDCKITEDTDIPNHRVSISAVTGAEVVFYSIVASIAFFFFGGIAFVIFAVVFFKRRRFVSKEKITLGA